MFRNSHYDYVYINAIIFNFTMIENQKSGT